MASQLQDNLNEILRQKNAYLLPNNIKKGVEVLGITGNLEVGTNTNIPTATYTASGDNLFVLNTTTGYYEYSGVGEGILTIDIIAIESGTMNINYKGNFLQGGESQTNLYLDNTLVGTLSNQSTYTDYPIQLSSAGSHTVKIEVLSDDNRTTMEVKLKIEQPITSNTVLNGYTGFVNGQKVLGTLAPSENLDTELNAQDQKLAELEAVVYNATQPQSKPNIFVQTTEPETKKGIWLQKEATPEHYTYDEEVFVAGNWMASGILRSLPYDFSSGAVVSKGSDAYLFGSYNNTYAYKYDSLTDTYTQLTNTPHILNNGDAAIIGDNVYIFGGTTDYEAKAYKYDTLTDTYTALTDIPYKFTGGRVVAHETDIYLFGSATSGYYRNAYKYDTLTDTYTQLTDIPYDFYSGALALVGDYIYLIGSGSYYDGTRNYRYNISNNNYTSRASLQYKRYGKDATVVGTDIYLFGANQDYYLDRCYKYNTLTNTYTELAKLPTNRYVSGSREALLGNKIYIFGGGNTPCYTVSAYILESKTYQQNNLVVISQGKYNNVGYQIELNSNPKDVVGPKYAFADAWYYTTQGGLETDIPTYYGDGTNWVKIKN